MKKRLIRNTVVKWAKKIGHGKAFGRLTETEVVSPSMAEKLIDGRYPNEPIGDARSVILKALAQDGFVILADEKAS